MVLPSMRSMDLFLRNRTIATLDDDERAALEHAVDRQRQLPARATLLHRGEPLHQSTILIRGFMIRFIDDVEGGRQVVAFHIPGDFVDLHGYPLHVLDHSLATVTDVSIATVPHVRLQELTDRYPDLMRKLWGSTLLDAAMHREWLFMLGRLDAVGRIAHFIAETNARLCAGGLSDGATYRLPITQADLSEITGLTSIHVNRVLRTLREEKVCIFRSGQVEILDRARLHRLGQFDPAYLYLKNEAVDVPSTSLRMDARHG